ncbi:hypothetical protein QK289_04555 [Exiguobacterium antarcticum]|uniref:Lipoprotein n=1 Tax=Exiguobacterium antarcticum TaxID=132920 RepID=A0ABT6QZZ8_9BACL|nr:hypothetical protein [Exiguobacterium antarcticum]MDI3234270.1 hypothetical protein [Exiguobacterium antarcticum]
MRKFKFVLILAVVSFLTIGIYTLFIRSIEESEFVVETVKGNPKQPAVRSVHAEMYDLGLKDTDYNVGLDGRVQKTSDNLITDLFSSPYDEEGAPADFRRFIRLDSVATLEQEGITYGLGIQDDSKWELQYWDAGKKRVVKKIFPAPAESRKLGEIQLDPYRYIDNNLYVYAQDYQTNSETLLYKIELKNETIQNIDLPYTADKNIQILAIADEKIVYQSEENTAMPDEIKRRTYLKDGKNVQSLKELDSININQTELSTDGTKLIMLENDSDQSSWIVFDLASKKLEQHKMAAPKLNEADSGLSRFIELKNGLIYTANRTDDGVINVLVIDPISKRVLYEGNIKDKLKRKETSLNSLILD